MTMPYAIQMHDEQVAFLSLERLVWPAGPICPHCGEASRLGRLNGLSTPIGAWKCYSCRKPFTVRHGTIFHNSHVPIHVWLQALYLLVATKQKIGSQRLGQILGVSARTAWHLKLKIMPELDVAPADVEDGGPWWREDCVMRCALPEQEPETHPGRALYEARYQRFLDALAGHATRETDMRFMHALHRLLPVSTVGPEYVVFEEQLELGLFAQQQSAHLGPEEGLKSDPHPKA